MASFVVDFGMSSREAAHHPRIDVSGGEQIAHRPPVGACDHRAADGAAGGGGAGRTHRLAEPLRLPQSGAARRGRAQSWHLRRDVAVVGRCGRAGLTACATPIVLPAAVRRPDNERCRRRGGAVGAPRGRAPARRCLIDPAAPGRAGDRGIGRSPVDARPVHARGLCFPRRRYRSAGPDGLERRIGRRNPGAATGAGSPRGIARNLGGSRRAGRPPAGNVAGGPADTAVDSGRVRLSPSTASSRRSTS